MNRVFVIPLCGHRSYVGQDPQAELFFGGSCGVYTT